AGFFGRRTRRWVHNFILTGLIAVIALPALKKILEIPGTAILVGAIILGIGITIVYIRFQMVKMFLTFLSPALLIIPGLFLFNSQVSKVVFVEKDPQAVTVKVDATAPVIMVVFDGFPVTSLMDEYRLIDSIRYPNFAALAQDAYWFRNATTVAENTGYALPVILTGSYPNHSFLPIAADHPHNIFTLLGGSYDLEVFEPITQLCPERLCRSVSQRLAKRMSSLMSDLSIVYLHILLPEDFSTRLPPITQNWKDFAGNKSWEERALEILKKDRLRQVKKFINAINVSKKPTLYFLHTMFPHAPYKYFPSGKTYNYEGFIGLDAQERWSSDEWAVISDYQRYLLQVGFVDTLLGKLLDRLRVVGLYDLSLIVVTADHGVSFRPNDFRRPITKTNFQDIMPVPLFIKAPNQHEGIISDRNVETVDILPTIADILDIRLPWSVDGYSAIDLSMPEREGKVIYFKGAKERLVVDSAALEAKYKTLKRKLALFGSGASDKLYKIGPHNELVGQDVSKFKFVGEVDVITQLDQGPLFAEVDPESSFIPANIIGRVLQDMEIQEPINLAVAVNGIIRAVTRTFDNEGGEVKFSAIVPEIAFQEGKNEVEVFVVSEGDGQLQLARTKSRSTVTYTLTESGSRGEIITSSDGQTIPVIPDALQGHLDAVNIKTDYVQVSGWAADIKNSQIPEAIVIFVNGEYFYSALCNAERPDLVNAFGNLALRWAGFKYPFPIGMFKNINPSEMRVFAVSKRGEASELQHIIKSPSKVIYTLAKSGRHGEIITSSDGKTIPVIPNALQGYLDAVDIEDSYVQVSGWAADVKNSELPDAIVIFVNRKSYFIGQSNVDRLDVVNAYRNSALLKSGFNYYFFVNANNIDISEVRMFALSKKGVATELNYPKDYKWGRK
ncbi:MAG: sulfatase-like hydrolase/transferase, partial [Thermodesulfobacteriota bacterium]